MGKRRHRKPSKRARAAKPATAAPVPASPAAPSSSGRRLAVGAVAGAVAALAAFLVLRSIPSTPRDASEFPPPPPHAAADTPVFDDFVGAAVCGECHQTQYAAWRGSTHGEAGGLAGPETVIAGFDGTPIRFADGLVTPSITADGAYVFTVEQTGRGALVFPVDGVIGKGHMVGGGTQGYVSNFPDGTVRFLPFDFIREEGVWFCNTNSRTDEGWIPITPEMRLADCGDWPPTRVLGSDKRYGNCQECHGSQITLRFDPERGAYETRVKSYAVNCESCHGPGVRHVQLARSGQLSRSADIAIATFGTEDKDASLATCFQCHALKDVVEPGYLPGKDLLSHYALKTPLLGELPFFPDGRIRTFAYQQNHLYSACYLNGSMTCVDCHDPHGQGYRDFFGRPLSNRFADEQCTSCHASKADDVTLHTNHAPDSPGSQCVSCHMPYLQHPELGDALRFARSDHTIPIPRPAFDDSLGVTNACSQCHAGQSIASLQEQTTAWYGELKPHKDIITGLLRADRVADRVVAAEMLLRPSTVHPAAQVAALDQLIRRHLEPNMAELESEIVDALFAVAESGDLDVRSTALAALHLARGHDPLVRTRLVGHLVAEGDDERHVRNRWVLALGTVADGYRTAGDAATAIVVYRKALEILPDHPGIHVNLAGAYDAVRDYANATATFLRALELDPNQPLALVNLGVVYEHQESWDAAAEMYRRAIALSPGEALAHFNLGNYHLRRNEFAEALPSYRTAIALDPSLGRAHWYLARTLFRLERFDEALNAVRQAVEFDPQNANAQQMLAQLEQALGRDDR